MNTQHTPTPWVVARRKDNRVPNRITTEAPIHAGAVNPAEIARVIDRADCAFIVRACNSHDELVAALNNIIVKAVDADLRATYQRTALELIVKEARAALAKAGAA